MSFIKKLFGNPPSVASQRAPQKPNDLLTKIKLVFDRLAFNWDMREKLYRHLSGQVANGITVEAALDSFSQRLQRRKKFSSDKIVTDLSRRMRDGSTLAAALSVWTPLDEVSIIKSGEMSGNLPKSLDLLVEAKRRVARVNNGLKSAMVNPSIYLAAVYGMIWGIGRFVIPELEQALPQDKASGLVYALYVAGNLANSLWALLPPILLLISVALVVRSLPKWTGSSRITAEAFFPYSFYRDIQGYIWLMSFAALLRAGMTDTDILKSQVTQANPWLKERLHAIWWRMDNGASLSAALISKGRNGMPPFSFPNPDIVDDISSMGEFDDFPEKITLLASQWAEGLELSVLVGAKKFGSAMEMLMYLVMGFLMVAINSMSSQLNNVSSM